MVTVDEAQATILGRVQRLSSERVGLLEANGRVLDDDLTSGLNVPSFDNSAVDGYAVRAGEVSGAGIDKAVTLPVAGEITAGMPPDAVLSSGTALKIMTGAPLPAGADAVVMVEDTRAEGDQVQIFEAAETGQHIRRAGEDIRQGSVVLTAGTRLRPAHLGILATLGETTPRTIRLPRVAIVSTGDEVVEAETTPLPPGKIRNSNQIALAALIADAGAILHSRTHLPDDLNATEAAFRALAESVAPPDVIVTSGGVSVGDRDYVKMVLEKLGELELWKVAMKPGKPLAFGHIGPTLFFGLPGNPVSTQVTFELFVRPALWKMAGRSEREWFRPQVRAVLQDDITHTPGRREYVRALTTTENGQWVTRTTGPQGSGMQTSLLSANSLLVVPLESEGFKAGQIADVLLLDLTF